ncbi:bifunctional diguanylate cyclase/phosphodiesterase [Nitrincola tapanii]|uniref:cyclic-guanylate-specific phosphodiesterase n=2 Tax=Nitrincola tapanii TaxID=1708751 RepID=A0A5A9W1V0_9GAMM|nr:bifunctional diguanylate cyclase/phosphodiesterase [Nitrincola tapanii]
MVISAVSTFSRDYDTDFAPSGVWLHRMRRQYRGIRPMPSEIVPDEDIPQLHLILVDPRNHQRSLEDVSAHLPLGLALRGCHSLAAAETYLAPSGQNYLLLPVNKNVFSTLHQLQTHDPLTGVGNRQFFYNHLQQELRQLDIQHSLALISLDIDNFSSLNHQYGHDAGDRLVAALAKRLRKCKNGLYLSRIGGDEFALLLKTPAGDLARRSVKTFIEEIISRLLPAFQLDEREIPLFCSIGVALAPQQQTEFDALIRCSSLARKRAKRLRGHSYAIFDDRQDHTSHHLIDLEPELWKALQQQEFTLFYQPRVCLRSGEICGAEALIRWQHPERGLITPDTFIPIAERSGLIVPIGYWVIERAGRDLKRLTAAGLQGHLGVNLSFRQFQDGYLANTIERLIQQQDINTSMLEFELTETALFSDEHHVRQCMETLGALGVEFSLDDFGTGYSSFSMLQKLPISTLKIDKSFVAGIGQNSDDEEIVRTIISLAKNLQKKVIAEGVETPQQLAFLQHLNCPLAQGYAFSPPVDLDTFLELLNQPNLLAQCL